MTWTKLSDDFPDDCWTLSDQAHRLHVEALCWSNRKLLDCRIPAADLRRFAKHGGEGSSELLAAGWWRVESDAYVIVHHAGYQRTRDEVVRQQEANARNGRKGGRPRKAPREIAENPVGLRVVKPDENPEGRDRTGRDRKNSPSSDSALTSDEDMWEEVRALESADVDE